MHLQKPDRQSAQPTRSAGQSQSLQLWGVMSVWQVVGFSADSLTDISSMYHIEDCALNFLSVCAGVLAHCHMLIDI